MFNNELIINKTGENVLYSHVQVSEVKDQLSIQKSETDDDSFIASKILAASLDAKGYVDHYFNKTELSYKIYNFEASRLKFPISPLLKISMIRVSDNGVDWTDLVEFTDFIVDKTSSEFGIIFASVIKYDYLELDFIVGFEIGNLPENVRAAIVLKAGDMFDSERSGYNPQKVSVNGAYHALLNPYMNFRVSTDDS